MTLAPNRGIVMASLLAVMMHLFLFAAIRPKTNNGLSGMLVPPRTSYLVPISSNLPMTGNEVRTVRSPVIFSLPSNMGFSRELSAQDVSTRLSFSQPGESEQFLQVDSAGPQAKGKLDSQALMLTTAGQFVLDLPSGIFKTEEKRAAARRVNLTAELKERLQGGVVLPPVLNQTDSSPWEIHASVSVSEQGTVKHVFLDQPLEVEGLNQPLLQLLYGLHFKPGEAIDGSIEIYSPEATP